MNLVGSIFGPCFYLFSIQTGAENGPYQVQKWPPFTGPFLGPQAKPFHLPSQTSDEEGCACDADCGRMFRKPYGPFSDAFFGLGVAEWCDFSVLVAFQRPPVFRSDSTTLRQPSGTGFGTVRVVQEYSNVTPKCPYKKTI